MLRNHNTPFLLIRGLVREQRHWGDFIAVLQQQFPENPLITLDVPGNGQLYQAESPTSIAAMTDALRLQLQATTLEPVRLIALSMGGMIAIDWMNRYPSDILGAVLINTSVRQFSPFYQRLRWQNYGSFLKLIGRSAAHKEQTILALTSNQHGQNAPLIAAWQHWQQQCPVSGRNALRQIWAAATFVAVKKPEQPLLILTSSADRLVDCQCSIALQQAWQVAFQQHQTAGHDLPLDDPSWVSLAIKQWINT